MVGVEQYSKLAYRRHVAAQEAPVALLWLALLVFALSVIDAVATGFQVGFADVLHLGVVSVFLLLAFITSRRSFPPALVPWAIATAALSVVGSLELEVRLDPTALGLAYVLMAMIAFGPLTLDYRAQAAASAVMLLGFLPAVAAWGEQPVFPWVFAALAALGLGAVLLHVRLRGIDALGRAKGRLETLAMRDPLTGAVNRNGIEERMPELASLADRHSEQLFVVFVDVDGLKHANDQHGHDFGDEVLVAVAGALRVAARTGDLVGRWGGDEFIVVGMGQPPLPSEFEDRIVAALADSGLGMGRWPHSVSCGVAALESPGLDVDRLITTADASMYERRRARRVALAPESDAVRYA